MAQQLTPEQLCSLLEQTLSPVEEVRRKAEEHLKQAQCIPGHPLVTLQIVAGTNPSSPAVRQAASVHFKNVVKKGWDENNENGTDGIVISADDRNVIKSHLVELMCTVPPNIQAQCSESISLIAAVDFPNNWKNLLPELVQKFNSPEPEIVNGVLLTANSILKRFRYVQRSDELYADILYSLEIIQAPLLTLMKTMGQAVDAYANDAAQLKPRFASLRSICRIFYSLNYQDLPEYFEDHIGEWMAEFEKYLQYRNPLLTDEDEETDPSPVDKLQSAIVENLKLYADKDEECFVPFLPQFTTLVWNLLMSLTAYSKHDILANSSIRFLSSLVAKLMYKDLFKDEATLREIIGRIVIPNLTIREVDEERFEDDPQEFIVTDIEGDDAESRRRCSQELLRAMCRQFEEQTTQICSEHVGTMLTEFAADPANKWAKKDVAIHLMFGIAIKAESSARGVSQVNAAVDVIDFFSKQIVPELQDTNHAARPMLKATAIKFVSTFRNQFSTEQLKAIMPLLISHLASPAVVVHTYAAYAIEKILTTRTEPVPGSTATQLKFGPNELKPFLEQLFTALFAIVENTQLNENQYVMKCVMRALSVASDDVIPVTPIVLEKLTAVLAHVAKNPRNPQFNHYMFESIAVLIRSVCSKNPEATSSFEQLLFPPFQTVLEADVSEFTPYVFQILAQLLEYRPRASGLGPAYSTLFPPLLSPSLWERRGNVPALTRLICAYLKMAAAELSQQSLVPMLGIFQKLVAARPTEASGMELLCMLVVTVPQEQMKTKLTEVFRIILSKIQAHRTEKFVRLTTHFFAVLVGKHGSQEFFQILESMQAGLGFNIITGLWISRFQNDMPVRLEAKAQVVGLTRLLQDIPAFINEQRQLGSQLVAVIVAILTTAGSGLDNVASSADDVPMETEIVYDSAYSNLHFAKKPADDPFADITNSRLAFLQCLHTISTANPGRAQPWIQQGLQSDPKLAAGLEGMLTEAGIRLV